MMNALGATVHNGGICDSASTAGYECVLGRCLGPDIESIEGSDLVILWGTDVTRTVQHLQPALQRLCKRGVPVVAIDVYRTDTIRALERWGGRGIVLRPGTDAALALCLARIAFEVGFADREFLANECLGAEAFEVHARAGNDLEATERTRASARRRSRSSRARCRSRAGRSSRRASDGRGGGTARWGCARWARWPRCSVTGTGCTTRAPRTSGWRRTSCGATTCGRKARRRRRLVQVGLGRELAAGRFRAAFVWCHNPAVTLPDSAAVRRGLAREDLFLVVHEHFLTETAELADVVLPATMFVEHADVYRSYGHRSMQYARKASEPPAGARTNVATFAAIAKRLGLRRETWDATDEGLCEELLEASRDRIGEEGLARLRAGEPVKLPPQRFEGWGTPSGKIELWSAAAMAKGQPAMATYVADDAAGDRGAFVLVGAPSVATHNSTYAHSARHVRKAGPPRVYVSPEDARALGLATGGRARLSNARGSLTLLVEVSDTMPAGLVRVDGLPRARDLPEKVGLNALTSGATSDLGGGNVMYSARVDLAPA
jgi:anaerobic selenocysteine-containing dehydrogenase